MTFSVRSLLELTELETVSLTPGIGEERQIEWAHVCELAEPWQWLGDHALVMTTGLGVPEGTAAQCVYLSGMHAAGIAAVAIDAEMPAHPFTPEALAHATRLGFPVLETAHAVRFVALAKAVAAAAQQEYAARVQQTERMYAALGEHDVDDGIDALLDELGRILRADLSLHPRSAESGPGALRQLAAGIWAVPLLSPGEPELQFAHAGPIDRALLQHAAGIVDNALAVKIAARRSDWLHGSLLLSDLCDESVASAPSDHLVAAYGVHPPYLLTVSQHPDSRAALEEVHAVFGTGRVPALATLKDGQVLVLVEARDDVEPLLIALADTRSGIGVSAMFTELDALPTALRQARSALIRAHQSGRVLRFEEHETTSLFLPNDPEQLRGIARQVLGPLRTYDEQRGTSLTHTLRIFLEENRSWVRASERLFVHRQTLIARVSRIEKIIGRDLSSMEDTAECWLAVQAAIGCGDLAPSDPPPEAGDAATAP
ncbi:purine catabolism regulator [Leucobacter luti]|uniref:PucR family transcriptional regulator n=1 Tax=Leucobacter luti TaxID=340320 RepID=UPI001042C720|nr:PucR family transcriptional regulator [Leucobacter luti]MCW2289749.1 purine catabolism regulator [Leucobacter luti]TCK34285.1 purine catabolism regulator [Leucobacter luti]